MFKFFVVLLIAQCAAISGMEKAEPASFPPLAELNHKILASVPWSSDLSHSLQELTGIRTVCRDWNRLLHLQDSLFPLVHAHTELRWKPEDHPWNVAPLGASAMVDGYRKTPEVVSRARFIEHLSRFFAYLLSLEKIDPTMLAFKKNFYLWLRRYIQSPNPAGIEKLNHMLLSYAMCIDFTNCKEDHHDAIGTFIPLVLSFRPQDPMVIPSCIGILFQLAATPMKEEIVRKLQKKNLAYEDVQLFNALLGQKSEMLLPNAFFDQALERAGVTTFLHLPPETVFETCLSHVVLRDDEKNFLSDVRQGNLELVRKHCEKLCSERAINPILDIAFICSLYWCQEKCAECIMMNHMFFAVGGRTLTLAGAIEKNVGFLEKMVEEFPQQSLHCAHACNNLASAFRVYVLKYRDDYLTLALLRMCHTGDLEMLRPCLEQVSPSRDLLEGVIGIFCAKGNLKGIELVLSYLPGLLVNSNSEATFVERRELLNSCIQLAWSNKHLDIIRYLLRTIKL